MGFRRADVGGSKRLPRRIKQLGRRALETVPARSWGARASLGCGSREKPSVSLSPLHSPCESRPLRSPGSRASFSCCFAKRAPSPPAQLRERSGPRGAALAREREQQGTRDAWPLSAPGGEQ